MIAPLLEGRRAKPTSEEELVRRAQARDLAAFEALAGMHADRLYAAVLRLVGDRNEAEDIVQETMLRAWLGIGRFQSRARLSTWLTRIAVNESNRALQRRSRAATTAPTRDEAVQIPAPAHEQPARRAEQRELGEALDLAIAALAPAYRMVIVLRDIEGLSTREAARVVEIGEAAFKSRLHQARLTVRAALSDAALIESST